MKAILKNNRKVIVDVGYIGFYKDEKGNDHKIYWDKLKHAAQYYEDELDFVEYYGG